MEPRPSEWDLVIKVKYGDTLRRIGAFVNGQLMDQNISKLRSKIITLFNFSPDTDLILTYTDEDGDTVTLVDDDELRDAIINQHLNPLRINVQVKSNSSSSSHARSVEASSASSRSPVLETQPLQISSAIDEAIKTVPEPFKGILSNLSHDVTKAVSSQPALTKLVEAFSKLGVSNASQPSYGPVGESSGITSGASTHLVDLNVSDEPKALGDPIPVTMSPTTTAVNPVLESNPNQRESGSMTQGVGATASACADLYIDVPKNTNVVEYPSINDLLTSIWTPDGCFEPEKEAADACRDGKSVTDAASTSVAPANQAVMDHDLQNIGINWPSVAFRMDGVAETMSGDSSSKQVPMNTAVPFTSQNGLYALNDVPISRHVGGTTPGVPSIWPSPNTHPYRRSHSHHENTPRTFHRGVQCDGCGMHPIVGPRFKSNVKEDYDLCSICFAQMGNEADYTRIDRAAYRAPRMFREFYPHSRHRFPSSHAFHGCGARSSRGKLDSRFIQDVTVLDGTMMPPSTHFTKIWRMRNTGTMVWPFGTQLVWVGGDQFGGRGSAELEIPVNGCAVDDEIDIAVDFTAPSRPGRYISYWRMASPSGQKYGQRVWVLIQVDNSRPNSAAGINLNLPPEINGRNGLGIIDVNAEPLDGGVCPEPDITASTASKEVVKPVVPAGVAELTPGEVGLVDAGAGGQLAQPTTASASYPLIDISEATSTLFHSSPAVAVANDGNDNPVEQTLLKELEEMGFKQIDLNKEILRLNEYDLEQSVDDLCGFAEWDPLLSELQEMGFSDKELNKKLLIKNGGSIKRAVLDLIAGEKAD